MLRLVGRNWIGVVPPLADLDDRLRWDARTPFSACVKATHSLSARLHPSQPGAFCVWSVAGDLLRQDFPDIDGPP